MSFMLKAASWHQGLSRMFRTRARVTPSPMKIAHHRQASGARAGPWIKVSTIRPAAQGMAMSRPIETRQKVTTQASRQGWRNQRLAMKPSTWRLVRARSRGASSSSS